MSIPIDVTFHPGWWYKNAGVCFNKDFFYNQDYRLEADRKMRRVLYEKFGDLGLGEAKPQIRPIIGSDLIASGFLHSEILGCEVRYSDPNPPEVICANLSDEEVESLTTPDLRESDVWRKTIEQADALSAKFGYVETCINLMGIQNIALDLRGAELFIDYYDNPSLAHHLLDICTRVSIDIGKGFKKYSSHVSAGVTAVIKQCAPEVYLTSNCSVDMVSLDTYESFLLEYDNALAGVFAPFGIHHCGKAMEHVVDGYARVRDLTFAEVGAFSDMEAARRTLPNVFLNARYSPVRLKSAEYSEMTEEISDILRKGLPLNLLSLSCVGIDASTSDSTVRDFLLAAKEALSQIIKTPHSK